MQGKGFPSEWLDKLKFNNDIVSTVSRYLTLTKRGGTFWACCPFHHEKTASFAVNEPGQFYHCFGCGEGGNVIRFVQKMEGLDFFDAVKMLAAHAGMELPDFNGDEEYQLRRKHRETLQNICRDSARYYHQMLKEHWGKKARDYLHSRGVTDSTITKLGLGYSANSHALPKHLLSKGYKKEDIIESGVCSDREGRLCDEMSARVVFPVIDHMGKVVGFSGRSMFADAYAKYKNTKTTPLFNKSSTIYCLNLLRKARLEKNYAILVEGQMDVVALQQAGFNNAIATMGTAFNQNHVRVLSRFVDEVIVCFDGDTAGQKAAVKCLEPLANEGLRIKVLELPEKLDPDEYIKKYGKEAYQNLLDNALPVHEFEIKYLAKKHNVQIKENIPKFVDECLKVIVSIKKDTEKEIYINLVANLSGLARETILRQLANTNIDNLLKQDNIETPYQNNFQSSQNYKAEQFVIASYLHKKPYAKGVEIEDFVNNDFKKIFEYLINNNFPLISKIYDEFDVENNANIKTVVAFNFDNVKDCEKEFVGCTLKMQLDRLLKEQENVNKEISNCQDENTKMQLLQKAGNIAKQIIDKKTLLNKVG